ncbi:MAG: SDR family oxidoreductase [Acidimicrobiia bacterium]|nr:SDR family oxidoreductase [Acidimicrobiia bacterium]
MVPVRIAVAGAGGFVGRALVPRLVAAGHRVVALGRRPEALPRGDGVEARPVDVGDPGALAAALAGVDVAFYLVHSMQAGPAFRARDRELALTFGKVAREAGIGRIVYLGGLGDAPASEHLVSRQEVGECLGEAGVPVVELRAAVVLGSGSISFEMLRYLTERLPVMVCPRWVRTRIQPIALADLLAYLERSLRVPPGVYEVGGAEVTTYREMIAAYARARGLRRRRIVDVPLLTPRLSSYWVDLVAPVDRRVSHALIESLVTEVVVRHGGATRGAFDIEPVGLDVAVRDALDAQVVDVDRALLDREPGLLDGVYCERVELPLPAGVAALVDEDLGRVGGDLAWYGVEWPWRIRLLLGRVLGERLAVRAAASVAPGAEVDWWTVVDRTPGTLVLRGRGWHPGDAWLGYRVRTDRLVEVGALRPRGVPGFLYWTLLRPIHRRVFVAMAHRRRRRAGHRRP